MPHLILEYSVNVADVADIDGLVDAVHSAALATGVAAADALRTRAAAREHYAIGDRHPDNMFVALTARLGAGRSDADKAKFVRALMDALTDYLGDATATMMLSVEYQEIDPAWRINENHLRTVIAERTSPQRTSPQRTSTS
jgi:5-carboxymethyl-2-hydroxymuconate isomerase